MSAVETRPVDNDLITKMLDAKKGKMKPLLTFCARCGLCADSCFLFRSHGGDAAYMPSYKVVNSLGRLYKTKGRIDRALLEEMKPLIFRNCVLCKRCYCPLGVDLPSMISFARTICRTQGICGVYPHTTGAPE